MVNDVRRDKKDLPLDSIYAIKKFMGLGHKLVTLNGDVSIPFRLLSSKDTEMLLTMLNLKIKAQKLITQKD